MLVRRAHPPEERERAREMWVVSLICVLCVSRSCVCALVRVCTRAHLQPASPQGVSALDRNVLLAEPASMWFSTIGELDGQVRASTPQWPLQSTATRRYLVVHHL